MPAMSATTCPAARSDQDAAGCRESPFEMNRPMSIHPFGGMPGGAFRSTITRCGLELHDVDVPMDLLRDAVHDRLGGARRDHAAQGPCLALRLRDLSTVPVDRRRIDRPVAASRGHGVDLTHRQTTIGHVEYAGTI